MADLGARKVLASPNPEAEKLSGRPGRVAVWALLASVLGAGMWLGVPLCPSAGWLGVPCPGCGLTRASLALLQGNWLEALHQHPLVIPLAPLVALLLAQPILRELGLSDIIDRANHALQRISPRVKNLFSWALLALMFGVWMARFGGFFGGPARVATFAEWAQERGLF